MPLSSMPGSPLDTVTNRCQLLHRITTRRIVVLAIAISFLLGNSALAGDRPRQPNIIIILADDLGYGDLGCYNKASQIPTPNLDRFATQGLRFTDTHTPSAVCTPTRYGLLTGRYCWRTPLKQGVLQGYSPILIEKDRLTVASLLKQHGYATACIGKWHLGLGTATKTDYAKPLLPGPNTFGFDYFFGIPASLDMPPYVFVENDKVTEAPTGTIAASEMRRKGGDGFWRAGPIAPGFKHIDVLPRTADKAVEFIGKQTPDKPFFLYFPLSAPHTPWLPTAEFQGKSKAGWYGDFVVHVDAVAGRVLKALDDAKLTDNTLVIFTSDNGAHWLPSDIEKWVHRANGPLRGQKADIWDGGHRVPFIVRWPGKVNPGTVTNEMICLTDILATTAAVVGAKLPKDAGEDSFNLLPVLLGTKLEQPMRMSVVHHSADGTFGLRQGPWKLALALGSHGFSAPVNVVPKEGDPKGQLYNLDDDPAEQNNLWLKKPEVVERLTRLLEKMQADGRSRPE